MFLVPFYDNFCRNYVEMVFFIYYLFRPSFRCLPDPAEWGVSLLGYFWNLCFTLYRRSLFPFPRRLLYAVLLFTLCPVTPILSLAGCQTLPDGLSVGRGTSRTKHCFVSCFSHFPHWIDIFLLGVGLAGYSIGLLGLDWQPGWWSITPRPALPFCLTLWLVLFCPASFGNVGVVLDLLTHFFLWCVCLMMFGRPEWRLACLWALTSPCLVSAPPLWCGWAPMAIGFIPLRTS